MCWVWPIRCDRRSREGFPLPLALQGVWQPLLRLAEGGEAWPLHGITDPLRQRWTAPYPGLPVAGGKQTSGAQRDAVDVWSWIILCHAGLVPCVAGRLAASLASTHHMPRASPLSSPSHDNQNRLQALPVPPTAD